MVGVGKMLMGVHEGFVPVSMRMPASRLDRDVVCVLVVFVVAVGVQMLDLGMSVLVRVMLAQVEPDAERHQRTGAG